MKKTIKIPEVNFPDDIVYTQNDSENINKVKLEYFTLRDMIDNVKTLAVNELTESLIMKGAIHRLNEIKACVNRIHSKLYISNPELGKKVTEQKEKTRSLKCHIDFIGFTTSNDSNIIVKSIFYKNVKSKRKKIMLEVFVNEINEVGQVIVRQREPSNGKNHPLDLCKELLQKQLNNYDWVLEGELY